MNGQRKQIALMFICGFAVNQKTLTCVGMFSLLLVGLKRRIIPKKA